MSSSNNHSRSVVSKLKKIIEDNPNITDFELKEKLNETKYNFSNNALLDSSFTFINPFGYFEEIINHQFNNLHDNNSYFKSVKSVTNYNNGITQSKIISETEKIKDGQKIKHKKIITENKDNIVIEKILPNGQCQKQIIPKHKQLLN